MRRRPLLLLALLALLLGGLALFLLNSTAPAASGVSISAAPCQTNTAGDCLRLASVSGDNLDGQSATFPAALAAQGQPYSLVVMPFDREQQVDAAQWLPIFQALAEERGDLAYYSIAALDATRIAPLFRTVIRETMNAAISDPALRARTYLLFLDDQPTFLGALGLPDIAQMRVLILSEQGELLYVQEGAYSAEAEAALREALARLGQADG